MKKFVVAVCLSTLVLSAAAGQTADEWLDRADEYFNKQDWNNAIAAYSEALKLDPDYYTYRDRGNAYYNKGDYDKAIADYTQVIRLIPNWPDAYTNRGLAYYKKGDWDRAIADHSKVIALNPKDPDGYSARGDAYGAKGIYYRAFSDYSQFLRIYPPEGSVDGWRIDKSKPADMWIGATLYQEMQISRFLGNTTAAARYDGWLKSLCDRNGVTRAEFEAFYRRGIGSIIADTVDETLIAGKSVNNDTRRVIDQIITTPIINYYLTPNNSNFDEIKRIEKVLNEINSLNTSSLDTQAYKRISDTQGSTQAGLLADLIAAGLLDIQGLIRNAEMYDKLGSRLPAQIARQAVNELRTIQSRIISREFRVNNAGNVECEKINMYKAVYSLNAELANRIR